MCYKHIQTNQQEVVTDLRSTIDSINHFWGIDNNTSATIFITLFIFALGFIITGFASFIKRLLSRYKYRKHFRAIVKSIGQSSERQSKRFDDGVKTLDIKHKGNFALKSGVLTHLDNIDKIDFNLLYEAYFFGLENTFSGKLRLKAFDKIWAYCSQLKKIEERYPEQLNSFIQRFNELEDKRNESLTGFRKLLDNIIHSTRGQQVPQRVAEYLKSLDKIMLEWQKLDERERTHYYIVNEQVVQPIRKLNKTYQELPVTLEMNNFLLAADHYFASMERLIENYHDMFKSYFYFYKLTSKIFQLSISIL